MTRDLQLVSHFDLQPGDRIVVPKSTLSMVQHHAIFLGFTNNHYWFIENKEGIGVRIITAENLFTGVSVITRIKRFIPTVDYSRNDLVKLAISKKGKSYNLFNYNCEHLANELQNRIVKSKQAETGIGLSVLAGIALLIGIAGAGK